MSIVVVAVLIVLWAWILLPGAVRERRRSPITSVSRFERSMAQLARAKSVEYVEDAGSGAVRRIVLDDRDTGAAAARAAARRRQVLTGLTAATTLTLVLARLVGGPTWALFGLAALLLGVYLVLLAHRWIRVSREEAQPLVRPVPGSGQDGSTGHRTAVAFAPPEPPLFGWSNGVGALEAEPPRVAEW
jgi:predicted MFS family arabinose efflux permease